jgi:hypothetical protein
MPTATATPTTHRLAEALASCRLARHHPDCSCGLYRPGEGTYKGSPFCTAAECRWTSMVDRILTTIQREQR